MKINSGKLLLFAVATLFSWTFVFCGELPFSSNCISECFGPRIHPVSGVWQFHSGIDYNPKPGDADKGMPIPSVENCIVGKKGIYRSNGNGGWVLTMNSVSGNNMWQYFHIFDNALYPQTPIFRVRSGARGLYIQRLPYNGVPGKIIEPGVRVNVGEFIAPIGISGIGTGAHLHLQLNRGEDNPLAVLEHEKSAFVVSIENPKDGQVLTQDDLRTDFPIRVRVDPTQGKDLDKVKLYLDGKELTNSEFSYGGRINEDKLLMNASNGTKTGVDPEKGNFKRLFQYDYDITSLSEGKHILRADAISVNGSIGGTKSIQFSVGATKEAGSQISGEVAPFFADYNDIAGINLFNKTAYQLSFTDVQGDLPLDKNGNIVFAPGAPEYTLTGNAILRVPNFQDVNYSKDGIILQKKLTKNTANCDIELRIKQDNGSIIVECELSAKDEDCLHGYMAFNTGILHGANDVCIKFGDEEANFPSTIKMLGTVKNGKIMLTSKNLDMASTFITGAGMLDLTKVKPQGK